MTQPLDRNELAREVTNEIFDEICPDSFSTNIIILSALTKLAAEYQQRLDIALTEQRHTLCKESDELREEVDRVREVGRVALTDLASHKAALKVAMDELENAKTLAATEDHRAFSEIRQGAEDALQQIKELKPNP